MSQANESGKFIFQGIQEGEGSEIRRIIFDPPLMIDFSIWPKLDVNGNENYEQNISMLAFATFDFGMEIESSVSPENNSLTKVGYEGLTPESSTHDILFKSLLFDLIHAFFHYPKDPNYTHYHWALYGNLKERVTLTEVD